MILRKVPLPGLSVQLSGIEFMPYGAGTSTVPVIPDPKYCFRPALFSVAKACGDFPKAHLQEVAAHDGQDILSRLTDVWSGYSHSTVCKISSHASKMNGKGLPDPTRVEFIQAQLNAAVREASQQGVLFTPELLFTSIKVEINGLEFVTRKNRFHSERGGYVIAKMKFDPGTRKDIKVLAQLLQKHLGIDIQMECFPEGAHITISKYGGTDTASSPQHSTNSADAFADLRDDVISRLNCQLDKTPLVLTAHMLQLVMASNEGKGWKIKLADAPSCPGLDETGRAQPFWWVTTPQYSRLGNALQRNLQKLASDRRFAQYKRLKLQSGASPNRPTGPARSLAPAHSHSDSSGSSSPPLTVETISSSGSPPATIDTISSSSSPARTVLSISSSCSSSPTLTAKTISSSCSPPHSMEPISCSNSGSPPRTVESISSSGSGSVGSNTIGGGHPDAIPELLQTADASASTSDWAGHRAAEYSSGAGLSAAAADISAVSAAMQQLDIQRWDQGKGDARQQVKSRATGSSGRKGSW